MPKDTLSPLSVYWKNFVEGIIEQFAKQDERFAAGGT
jgi:hypothetical protein